MSHTSISIPNTAPEIVPTGSSVVVQLAPPTEKTEHVPVPVVKEKQRKYYNKDDIEKLKEAIDTLHPRSIFDKLFDDYHNGNKVIVLSGSRSDDGKMKRNGIIDGIKAEYNKAFGPKPDVDSDDEDVNVKNIFKYNEVVDLKYPYEVPADLKPRSLVIMREVYSSSMQIVKKNRNHPAGNIDILITADDSVAPEFDPLKPLRVDIHTRPRLEERLIEYDMLKKQSPSSFRDFFPMFFTSSAESDNKKQIKRIEMRIIHDLASLGTQTISPRAFYYNKKSNHIDGDDKAFMINISGLMGFIAEHYPEIVVSALDQIGYCKVDFSRLSTYGPFIKLERLSDTPENYGLVKPELSLKALELNLNELPLIPRAYLWLRRLEIKEPHIICVVPLRGISSFQTHGSTTTINRNNSLFNPRSPFTEYVNKSTSEDFFKHDFWDAAISFKWDSYAASRFFLYWALDIVFTVLFAVSTTADILKNPREYPPWSTSFHYATIALGMLFLLNEIRQLIYYRWRYFNFYNFIDVITYFFPIFICICLVTENHATYVTDITAVTIIFLWLHFLQNCRVIPAIGIFANIVIGGVYHILPFLFIMLIITLGFGHGLWILLDNNIADSFVQNATGTNTTNVTNKFDHLQDSIKEVYWGWTGDSSAIQAFDNEQGLVNVLRAIMVFLLGMYMLNLLIAVLNEGYGNLIKKSRASYRFQMAQLIAEIELFLMLPHERNNLEFFPDDIYFEMSHTVENDNKSRTDSAGGAKLTFLKGYYQADRRENDYKDYKEDKDNDRRINPDDLKNYDEKHRDETEWRIEDNFIGDDGDKGVKNLMEALKNCPNVTKLHLRGNNIEKIYETDSLADFLSLNETLTHLDLGYNNIETQGMETLFHKLEENTTLNILDLRGNKINFMHKEHSLDQTMTNITELYLRENSIELNGAIILANCLKKNKSIIKLDLAWNYIRSDGIRKLAASLQENQTLTNLNLAGNEVGEDGASALSDCLSKNNTLIKLDLQGCEIGNEGAGNLAEITSTSLKELVLELNYIRLKGALKLLKLRNKTPPVNIALKNQAKKVRKVVGKVWKENYIPEDIIRFLGEESYNTLDLSSLSYDDNITDKKAKILADFLKQNNIIKKLVINSSKLHERGNKYLVDALLENSSLKELNIVGPNKRLMEHLRQNKIIVRGGQIIRE